jgi:oligosaccharyltransferase complex subunit beta
MMRFNIKFQHPRGSPLLLSPSRYNKTALGKGLKVPQLTKFIDSGRDIFLSINSSVSEELRELSQECGIDIDAPNHTVIDHFYYDGKLGSFDHSTLIAGGIIDAKPLLTTPFTSSSQLGPLIFPKGIGMSVSIESETAFLAAWASPAAYTALTTASTGNDFRLAGISLGLVAVVQTKNNARVAVVGSIDMCSDAMYGATATAIDGKTALGAAANAAFCTGLSEWTFNERGVLKSSNMNHHLVGKTDPEASYRINDQVIFSIDLTECSRVEGCKPYSSSSSSSSSLSSDNAAVQVELVMLDPYIRKTLTDSGNGTFYTEIKVPDVYGVFKWVLDYRRPGYSIIMKSEQIPIRPYRHDEYERFILQAYPYYATVVSMMGGFFVLGLSFLWSSV